MITVLFLLLALGQLGRISFFDQQINIYLYEIYLIGLLTYLFSRYKLKPFAENIKKPILAFLLILFASFAFSFYQFNAFENFIGFLYFLRLSVYFISFIYFQYSFKKEKKFLNDFKRGFLGFIIVTGVFSLIQYFFYPNLRNLFYLGWDPHLYRIFGVFFDTSTAGAILGLVLLYVFINHRELELKQKTGVLILILYTVLGALTYSRGFYLSILISLIVYFVVRKIYKYIVLTVLSFIMILVILPKPFGEGVNLVRVFSIESRIANYRQAFSIWMKQPVLGVGYNRLRYVKQESGFLPKEEEISAHSGASFHSSFLVILTTAGLIGFLSFLYLLWKLAETSEIARYLTLFLSFFSLWDNVLLHPFVLILFLLLISPSRRLL